MATGARGRGGRKGGGRRNGLEARSLQVLGASSQVPEVPSQVPNVPSLVPNVPSLVPDVPSRVSDGPSQAPIASSNPDDLSTPLLESSHDQSSYTHVRAPRGTYLSKNVPSDPTDRKVIHIIGSTYKESEVIRAMTIDFKSYFSGKQTQWHLLDKEFKDLLYKRFQDRFQYDTSVDPETAYKVWKGKAVERCRGTWNDIRKQCKAKSGSDDISKWKNFPPDFVREDEWNAILESWMTEKWQKLSKAGAKNRKIVPEDNDGTSSYVRHTGGSISFAVHRERMKASLGKNPSEIELFERLHKRKKGDEAGSWCDFRANDVITKYREKMKEKCQEDESESIGNGLENLSQVPFNPEAWVHAIGGVKQVKKGRVYGFGETQEAKIIREKTDASKRSSCVLPGSSSSAIVDVRTEVETQVQEKVDIIKAEMQKEMEKKFQEMYAMLNLPASNVHSSESAHHLDDV